MSFVIGVTGGIASGKTTVSDLFKNQFNIDVIDADIIARDVVGAGSPALKEIQERFGADILNQDGTLNRALLREKIFQSERDKAWVNNLLHPLIREQMLTQTQEATSPYCLLVIPLMVENKLQSLVDRVLVIDVNPEVQIERTVNRDGVPKQQVISILSSQASQQQRLAIADDVIENNKNSDLSLIRQQVSNLHQKYLALSGQNQSQ